MSEPACRRSWGRGRPARLPRPIPRTTLRRTAARTTEIGARDARGPRRPMAFRGGDCPPSAWRDGILVRRGSPGRSRACGPTPRATVPVRRLHGVQLLEDHLVERSLQDLRPNHPHLPVASPHEGPSLMWDGNRKMRRRPTRVPTVDGPPISLPRVFACQNGAIAQPAGRIGGTHWPLGARDLVVCGARRYSF